MNYNELKEKAHSNAVNHGFWKERQSNEHCLMLIITEVAELVEADRKDNRADVYNFLVCNASQRAFETYVKNTIEDEFADIAIRLFDLAGALGIDFDKMKPCRYFRAFDKFSFTENAFGLVKGLSRDVIAIEKRVQFGIAYIEGWANSLKIDLPDFINRKMKYNKMRPILHGKKY